DEEAARLLVGAVPDPRVGGRQRREVRWQVGAQAAARPKPEVEGPDLRRSTVRRQLIERQAAGVVAVLRENTDSVGVRIEESGQAIAVMAKDVIGFEHRFERGIGVGNLAVIQTDAVLKEHRAVRVKQARIQDVDKAEVWTLIENVRGVVPAAIENLGA